MKLRNVMCKILVCFYIFASHEILSYSQKFRPVSLFQTRHEENFVTTRRLKDETEDIQQLLDEFRKISKNKDIEIDALTEKLQQQEEAAAKQTKSDAEVIAELRLKLSDAVLKLGKYEGKEIESQIELLRKEIGTKEKQVLDCEAQLKANSKAQADLCESEQGKLKEKMAKEKENLNAECEATKAAQIFLSSKKEGLLKEKMEMALQNVTAELDEARLIIKSCTSQYEEGLSTKDSLQKITHDYDMLLQEYSRIQEKIQDPGLDHFLQMKMKKFYELHPGLLPAYNKTVTLLGQVPMIEASSLINSTHIQITTRLSRFLPPKHVIIVGGVLLFIIVFVPMFITTYFLINCKGCLGLRLSAVLLYFHVYFLGLAAACAGCAIILDSDPMTLLQSANLGSYIILHLLIGLLMVIYCLCMTLVIVKMDWSGAIFCLRFGQMAGTWIIAFLYYRLLWTPAMLEKPPLRIFQNNIAIPYLIPAFVFALNTHIEHSCLRTRKDASHIARFEIEMADQEESGRLGGEKKE